MFESFLRRARERLAKQDARARTRSSSGAFAGECAEQLIESRERCTAARRCGCRAGTARLLFFCRRFLFQIKRKCRNAGSIYHLIIVRSEGRKWILQFYFVPLSRHRCVEVAAPYKYASINCYNFRGWMISAPTYFDRSEITPQSRLRRASSPAGEP